MKGLQMMLSAMGIKIPEADIQAIELLLPKLPGLVKESVTVINGALSNYNIRLISLENQNQELKTMLKEALDESKRYRELLESGNGNSTRTGTHKRVNGRSN